MRKQLAVAFAATLTLAAGCQSRVVFTTHTSMGLDVSGTAQLPNKVSFSYNRFEAAIVPRKTNGEAHAVYGGMDADMKFFGGHTIKQTFATGKAAMLATGSPTDGVDFPGSRKVKGEHPLVFLTATTFGLHLTAGEKEMSPNLLLGYRRSEAAVIPVPEPAQEVRSVYADILINSNSDTNATSITTNFSSLRGVRIKQSFATGRAADALANTGAVKSKLAAAASLDPKVVAELKGKDAKRTAVLKAVSKDGTTVDAELLKKLLTGPDGKLLPQTEDWVQDFGGKPVGAFEKELLLDGDRHLETLFERATKSN